MARLRNTAAPCLLAALIAYALVLHFADVGSQLLVEDERHAVRVASQKPFLGIFTHYSPSDNCIPLTLYARFLIKSTGLTELGLRAPIMVADVLLLLTPLLLVRRLGRGTVFAAGALLATSPLVVHYAIVARPYTPAALLVLLTIVCWDRWLESRGRAALWLFAALASLATFWHPLCFVPVASLLLPTWLRVRARRLPPAEVAKAVLAVAGLHLALLGPGLPGLIEHRANTVGEKPELWVSIHEGYRQLTGYLPALAWALPPLLILGSIRIIKRSPTLGLGLAGAVAALLVAVPVIRPAGTPGTWARYVYVAWPLAVILAGAGLEGMTAGVARVLGARKHPEHGPLLVESATVIAALLAALLVPRLSPVGVYRATRTSFGTSQTMLRPPAEAHELPPVMAAIAAATRPGDTVLIGPAVKGLGWYMDRGLLHRTVMTATEVAAGRRAAGVELRGELSVNDTAELRASGARYLIANRWTCSEGLRKFLEEHFGSPRVSDERSLLFTLQPE